MRFSRTLAIIFGVLAPIAETIRRWHTWREMPAALIDDYVLGALLLAGAWATARNPARGRLLLAAAWGFTCGLGYYSVFGHLHRYRMGELDPAPISSGYVLTIKMVGFALAIAALILTLRASPSENRGTNSAPGA